MSVAAEHAVSTDQSFLTFDVGDSHYGLPIQEVYEILEHREMNRIPGSSAMVHGVFNHSGTIVPVVDLNVKFGGARSDVSRRTCIVVVSARHDDAELQVGLLVDAVRDVVDVAKGDLEPPPAFGSHIKLEYLEGLLRSPNGLTIILAVDRFLSAAELMEVSAAVSEEKNKNANTNE